jgi:hypothetical protein
VELEEPAPRRSARERRREGAPPAPWGGFPLVEICTLIALVLLVWGFIRGGRAGAIIIACGATVGSLAGLEVSLREHLAGFRSHSALLAGVVTVAFAAILYFARTSRYVVLVAAVVVFATAFWALRELFKRRSGGFGFR